MNQEDSLSRPGSSITEVENPNTVDWDGERDPANPQNWTRKRKWWAIALGKSPSPLPSFDSNRILVSAFTFMSPVASSILAPSLHKIGSDLSISNPSEESLCLSIFVLGFAFGPLLCAPLSEIYGRARVLQGSNLLFIIFNCACGFATTKAQLIAFRLLAGLGGSAPLALGSGVLADLFSADERGLAVSIYSFFPILGPAIGPISISTSPYFLKTTLILSFQLVGSLHSTRHGDGHSGGLPSSISRSLFLVLSFLKRHIPRFF